MATYDKHHKEFDRVVGDMVWLELSDRDREVDRAGGKLLPKYRGPYEIRSLVGPSTVDLAVGDELERVHVERLKPCLR